MNINIRLNGEIHGLGDLLKNPENAAAYAFAVARLNETGKPQVAALKVNGETWEIPVEPLWVEARLG